MDLTTRLFIGNWGIWIEWKPQDLWIGAFWKRGWDCGGTERTLDLWICLFPMLPIHVYHVRKMASEAPLIFRGETV